MREGEASSLLTQPASTSCAITAAYLTLFPLWQLRFFPILFSPFPRHPYCAGGPLPVLCAHGPGHDRRGMEQLQLATGQ